MPCSSRATDVIGSPSTRSASAATCGGVQEPGRRIAIGQLADDIATQLATLPHDAEPRAFELAAQRWRGQMPAVGQAPRAVELHRALVLIRVAAYAVVDHAGRGIVALVIL